MQTQYLTDNQSLYIDKKDDMPICSEGNQRQLIYIKELEQFQFCDNDKAWKTVNIASGKDGKDGSNGKDGLNGKDGENGKDGTIKNFTVYSNGKPIGWLVDESPSNYLVKTFKGYYFTIDSATGKIPMKKSNNLYRYANYRDQPDCKGDIRYSVDTQPRQIFAEYVTEPDKIFIYYSTDKWKDGQDIKSHYFQSSDSCLPRGNEYSWTRFAETLENNPDVTGFENKVEFELPITIAL